MIIYSWLASSSSRALADALAAWWPEANSETSHRVEIIWAFVVKKYRHLYLTNCNFPNYFHLYFNILKTVLVWQLNL